MKRVTELITAPAATPITLAEAKAHVRVTSSDADTEITSFLSSAVASCEQILQRKLITQTHNMYLSSWPAVIRVLYGNLQSVTHIKYTDIDDNQEIFSSDEYYVDTKTVPGRILLKNGSSWPSVSLNVNNPIEIQFVTGYGLAEAVPEDIKSAIKILIAHQYENRELVLISTSRGQSINEIPFSAHSLLSSHRIWDWIL